jgi:nucleoside-diphosphate-sugar epimerase
VKILVTGGCGFVGSHLVPYLRERGHAVVAPTRKSLDVLDCLSIERHLLEFTPDTIIHLAAITSRPQNMAEEARLKEVNVQGASNVAMLSKGSHFIMASTCHVYGTPTSLPISEDHPLKGEGAYARSKILAEEVAQGVARKNTTILRLFNLLGPGQRREFALAGWCWDSCEAERQGATEMPLKLVVGDLSLERDYLDVRDAVDGICRVVEAGIEYAGKAINICSGKATSLEELFSLCAPTALPEMITARLRGGDPNRIVGCNRALLALDWRQKHSLEASVSHMRSWIKSNLD